MTSGIATAENVGMSSERLGRIRPVMEAWVDRGIIAGASMMLARRNRIVYAEQVGQSDKEADVPMPADALFRIFSMTKPIVCTALMTLYEEGRFQLYTPVSKFIPGFGQAKVMRANPSGGTVLEDVTRPATVGDLMKHTAGLTYDFLVDSPVAELYREAELAHDAGRTLEEFVDALVEVPLAYQPGSIWHYSLSIDVAAYLVQLLSDRPLRDALQERIFGPLGMVDTDFCVPDEKRARVAAMYGVGDLIAPGMTRPQMLANWEAGVWERLDMDDTYPANRPDTFQRGGHGLFSTSADYMRFALMLLNDGALDGARILSRKTVELMHANHLPAPLLPPTVGAIALDGYGFGLGSRTLMDVGAAGLPGSVGEFGWSGAAKTYYWLDPAEEMAGVFMAQYQGMDEPDKDFRVLAYQAIVD